MRFYPSKLVDANQTLLSSVILTKTGLFPKDYSITNKQINTSKSRWSNDFYHKTKSCQ